MYSLVFINTNVSLFSVLLRNNRDSSRPGMDRQQHQQPVAHVRASHRAASGPRAGAQRLAAQPRQLGVQQARQHQARPEGAIVLQATAG